VTIGLSEATKNKENLGQKFDKIVEQVWFFCKFVNKIIMFQEVLQF
jgi:hypothetical protein